MTPVVLQLYYEDIAKDQQQLDRDTWVRVGCDRSSRCERNKNNIEPPVSGRKRQQPSDKWVADNILNTEQTYHQVEGRKSLWEYY